MVACSSMRFAPAVNTIWKPKGASAYALCTTRSSNRGTRVRISGRSWIARVTTPLRTIAARTSTSVRSDGTDAGRVITSVAKSSKRGFGGSTMEERIVWLVSGSEPQWLDAASQPGSKACIAPTMMGTPVSAATAAISSASSPDMANGFSHRMAFLPARHAAITWTGVELVRTADGDHIDIRVFQQDVAGRRVLGADPSGDRGGHVGVDVIDVRDLEVLAQPGQGRQVDGLSDRPGPEKPHTELRLCHVRLLSGDRLRTDDRASRPRRRRTHTRTGREPWGGSWPARSRVRSRRRRN